jgi:hypothetical protein
MRVGLEILGDVLTLPALRDDDIESERQVILEELAMDDDSPDDVAFRQLAARLFANHPLGRSTAGERATVGRSHPPDPSVPRPVVSLLPWWSLSDQSTTRRCSPTRAALPG